MTLTLVHDIDAESVGCRLLAKEINARLDGDERDIPLIPLFICEMIDHVTDQGADGAMPRKHPICSIAVTFVWAFRNHVDNRSELIAAAKAFSDVIRGIDDDDGWPTDRWLNAILGCCIAMELSLKDPAHVRWPAEAAGNVYRLVKRFHEPGVRDLDASNAWICQRFAAARRAARKLAQAAA